MMSRTEATRWMATLEPDSSVAIDDGGLALIEINVRGKPTGAYLEIGGTSDAVRKSADPDEAPAFDTHWRGHRLETLTYAVSFAKANGVNIVVHQETERGDSWCVALETDFKWNGSSDARWCTPHGMILRPS
jgi:hypothetical protein